jgi:hypothetical protein
MQEGRESRAWLVPAAPDMHFRRQDKTASAMAYARAHDKTGLLPEKGFVLPAVQ